MDPTGWWGIVVAAGLSGAIAALTATGVVWWTGRRDDQRDWRHAVRRRVADLALAASELPAAAASPADIRRVYWRMHGASLAVMTELGVDHAEIGDWLMDRLSSAHGMVYGPMAKAVNEGDASAFARLAGEISGSMVGWCAGGLKPSMTD